MRTFLVFRPSYTVALLDKKTRGPRVCHVHTQGCRAHTAHACSGSRKSRQVTRVTAFAFSSSKSEKDKEHVGAPPYGYARDIKYFTVIAPLPPPPRLTTSAQSECDIEGRVRTCAQRTCLNFPRFKKTSLNPLCTKPHACSRPCHTKPISGSEEPQHLLARRVDALAAVLRGEPQLALAV